MSQFRPAVNYDATVQAAILEDRKRAAEKVIQVAARTVDNDTGHYANESLSVTVDRRGVVAETDDFAGHIIEWGSEDQSPQAPIRTGAMAAGRFEPK